MLTIWIVLGLGLLVTEMLTGTFILLYVAIGCFSASILALRLPHEIALQIFVCAVVSVMGVVVLRKQLRKKVLQNTSLEADVGKEILIDQNMSPKQQTRISYQGTTWEAINLGEEEIRQGDHVKIVGIDSTILLLRKN